MKTKALKTATFVGAWLGYLAPLVALAQPIITTQPTNLFLNAPRSCSFFVLVSGTGPFAYQWLFDGTGIPGATRQTLIFTNPQPAQWGDYRVIVTNASGSVTSQVAKLKLFVPALHSLSGIQPQADGAMGLNLAGRGPFIPHRRHD